MAGTALGEPEVQILWCRSAGWTRGRRQPAAACRVDFVAVTALGEPEVQISWQAQLGKPGVQFSRQAQFTEPGGLGGLGGRVVAAGALAW